MVTTQTGFAVIYRWRLRDGTEDRFTSAWETVTKALMAERGARGSRLHRADDGTWVAYAQWPDKASWERSREGDPIDAAAFAAMREAIEESFEPMLLHPVRDHLVG